MLELINLLLPRWLLAPVVKPLVRLTLGLIAVPLFRIFVRRVARVQLLNAELEKDLEQWFRGSLLLLLASANMESLFFGWVRPDLREDKAWIFLGTRLLLAIGVVESMPDQALFSVIHTGPPKFTLDRAKPWTSVRGYIFPFCRGLLCRHLSRSSPVFAIMSAAVDGPIGWVCYVLAITQYLIIGLVTSRDRALDVLQKFDAAMKEKRQELIREQEELELEAGVPPGTSTSSLGA